MSLCMLVRDFGKLLDGFFFEEVFGHTVFVQTFCFEHCVNDVLETLMLVLDYGFGFRRSCVGCGLTSVLLVSAAFLCFLRCLLFFCFSVYCVFRLLRVIM